MTRTRTRDYAPAEPAAAYSLHEAAELARLSVRSLQRQIADGALIATRVGARTIVRPENLDAFLRAHDVGAQR